MEGAVRAVAWRSLLHLLRQPWKLVFPLLLGAALPLVLPATFTLEPLMTGALLLVSGLLAACLGLEGPNAPASLPISASAGRLARILPAAVVLGGLAGCAALIPALLSGAGVASVLGSLLLPWAALSLGAWGDAGAWMPKTEGAQMKIGMAFLPVLVVFLTVHALPWLVPLALLLLGLPGSAAGMYQLATRRLTVR